MDKHLAPDIDLAAFLRFSAYIKRSARNEARNCRREQARRSVRVTYFNEMPEGAAELIEDAYAAEAFFAVESELEIMGLRFSVEEPLYSELARLDEESFKVIAMTHWLGMTAEEISAETGIDPQKVYRIRRGVYKKLRKNLEGLV